jgi:hypothetical protein
LYSQADITIGFLVKNYPWKHTTAPLGRHPPEARLTAKKLHNRHGFAIFLAKINDLSKTRIQIKVQQNGEYYIEHRNISFNMKNNGNPDELTL